MKLWHLFEQDDNHLQPGEKRIRTDIKLRNLRAIEDRIWELERNIDKSHALKSAYQQDVKLQAALTDLIARLTRKQELLAKVKQRPVSGTDKILAILNTECSEYLKIWRSVNQHTWRQIWLYRGQSGDASVLEGRSWNERRTKDSATKLSSMLDDRLEQMGFKARRANSIFVTSSHSFAEQYGDHVYLIFPKNGFHFLSTRERDLVLENITQIADPDLINSYMKEVKHWVDAIKHQFPATTVWIDDLDRLVRWHSFTAVVSLVQDVQDNNWAQVPEQLLVKVEDFVTPHSIKEMLAPQDQDLADPMQSGNEIMIHGSYWALRADIWADYLKEKLVTPQS